MDGNQSSGDAHDHFGGEVGLELHPDIDQFLRIEEGEAKVMMGDSKEDLDYVRTAKADHAVFVPAGKWHNLVNLQLTKVLHIQFIYNQYSNIFCPLIKKQHRNKTIN